MPQETCLPATQVEMPYRILCNGTFQKSQEARPGLGLASPHRISLHNNRYGVCLKQHEGRHRYLLEVHLLLLARFSLYHCVYYVLFTTVMWQWDDFLSRETRFGNINYLHRVSAILKRRRVKSEEGHSLQASLKRSLSFFMRPPQRLAETLIC